MKTLIIYCSTYQGNTRKVAEGMAQSISAELMPIEKIKDIDFKDYDLIGLGSAINFAQHNIHLMQFIESVSLKNCDVFIFSTRCRPMLGSYHKALKNLLIQKGANLIGEFSCRGFDRTGPWVGMDGYNKNRPNSSDLFKATLFAHKMKRKILSKKFISNDRNKCASSFLNIHKRNINGNIIVGNITRINLSTCINCGKCLNSCPMHVFSRVNEGNKSYIIPSTDTNCIQCDMCADNCPTDSLYINESFLNGLRISLKESFGTSLQKAYQQ